MSWKKIFMLSKRLGQHFLINKQIVADIVRAGEVSKKPARNASPARLATQSVAGGDIILEVGPGKGVLTETLAEKAKKVIAVEKDGELVKFLKEKFRNKKNVEIIHGDILKVNIKNYGLRTMDYKLIANIPYYITSRFLRMFLSQARLRPSLMILMLQKEVAERIVAKDEKESLLSLSVKAYGKPKIIKIVKRGNFSPPPKVDSAIIKIEIKNVKNRAFNNFMEKMLQLARKAFQQKRKMLRHSLGKSIPEKYANRRPEELKLEDWVEICSKIKD